MADGITIGVGDALPYIVDSVLGFFGKDAASVDWKLRLVELTKLSTQQASMVQCVGMPQPIPITDIYQRTMLRVPPSGRTQTFEALIKGAEDAIIFAGPGWGKTTLLHWMYVQLSRQKQEVPLLFTLRWPSALENLKSLVHELERGRMMGRSKAQRIVFLVDGYDEIKESERQEVSEALMLFSSLSLGNFYLTCRSHYHVYDLKCAHRELAPFTSGDSQNFVRAYSRAYGADVDAPALLKELSDHHLGDFASHPLMLTLVCILKSGPSQEIPRRAIGLLRRALDTLTFRWDESKGVHRQSSLPLDGEERVRCLMRIAFEMNSPQEPWEVVRRGAAEHLALIQKKHINVRVLLEEMARFYGLLLPVGEEHWQFAHRTVHDYLSARYWVESGKFSPSQVREWDVHAAYAACLTADATDAMGRMLKSDRGLPAFMECLYNGAPFNSEVIARAIIARIATRTPRRELSRLEKVGLATNAWLRDDFFSVSSDEFLRIVFKECIDVRSRPPSWDSNHYLESAKVLALSVIAELFRRKSKIRVKYIDDLTSLLADRQATQFRCATEDHTISFSMAELRAVASP